MMRSRLVLASVLLALLVALTVALAPHTLPRSSAANDRYVVALRRATDYFAKHVAYAGAYKETYDLSLSQRDPLGNLPATAYVGLAYVSAFDATGDRRFLESASDIAKLLDRTQIGNTGGWWYDLYTNDYANGPRSRLFYRTDAEEGRTAAEHSDYSVFRNDRTLSALRFLMRFERARARPDSHVRRVIDYGLDGLVRGAYQPSGGYPDVYYPCRDPSSIRCRTAFEIRTARIPDTWQTRWPEISVVAQTQFYSNNDATTPRVIETLLEAWKYTGQARYRAAALRTADWLLRAQFPAPQPGWAQAYDYAMNPTWTRIYEPPALSARETAYVIRTLLNAYRLTRNAAYKTAAERAESWLRPLAVRKGAVMWWPMFVEFESNKPVFVDSDGRMTTDRSASGFWPNYGFFVAEDIRLIPRELREADSTSCTRTPRIRRELLVRMRRRVDAIVRALDATGRWVTRDEISTETFVTNVASLAAFIGLRDNRETYIDAESVIRGLVTPKDDPCRYLPG